MPRGSARGRDPGRLGSAGPLGPCFESGRVGDGSRVISTDGVMADLRPSDHAFLSRIASREEECEVRQLTETRLSTCHKDVRLDEKAEGIVKSGYARLD